MSECIFMFTFSPIQPFIGQARRTSDLYAGSKILANLAGALLSELEMREGRGELEIIYPSGRKSGDAPNMLVVQAAWSEQQPEALAKTLQQKLYATWDEMVKNTLENEFEKVSPKRNSTWQNIWDTQLLHGDAPGAHMLWQCYWAAAELKGNDPHKAYRSAYKKAQAALAATKRTRSFMQVETLEPGYKDTLSGQRLALHTQKGADGLGVQAYWSAVSKKAGQARVRPDGRERLDAIGVIKRFGPYARMPVAGFNGFPSTSSVASLPFRTRLEAEQDEAVQKALKKLCGMLKEWGVWTVTEDAKRTWPFDGDFLYKESYTTRRLEQDYGLKKGKVSDQALKEARQQLDTIYGVIGRPSPYYAILLLDGDNMGRSISQIIEDAEAHPQPLKSHKVFSEQVFAYTEQARQEIERHGGIPIYMGGDDVLLMVPLAQAFNLGASLAKKFHNTTGSSASAGIAVVHHHAPLQAGLDAARDAEKQAKAIDGNAAIREKNAVSVNFLKRAGAPRLMVSKWETASKTVPQLTQLFRPAVRDDALVGFEPPGEKSAPLAANFVKRCYALTDIFIEVTEPYRDEFVHLFARHLHPKARKVIDPDLARDLVDWAGTMPDPQTEMLSHWMAFCHFVAQGGQE